MIVEYSNVVKSKTYYQNSLLKNSFLRDHSSKNAGLNTAYSRNKLAQVKSSDCIKHPNRKNNYTSNLMTPNKHQGLYDLPNINKNLNTKPRIEALTSRDVRKPELFRDICRDTLSTKGKQISRLSPHMFMRSARNQKEEDNKHKVQPQLMEYIKYKIMSDGFTPDDKLIKNKKDLEVCINAYSKIKKLKMKNKGNNEFAEQEHIKLNFFSKIAKFQNPSQAVYIGLSKASNYIPKLCKAGSII